MALKIGRAGNTLVLPEPTDWQNSGPRAGIAGQSGSAGWAGSTVTGGFQVSPVTDALRLRDQLLGYIGNFDESIVPVTSDAQPRDNGYYRIASCDITTVADTLTNGFVKYQLELDPVPGYAQPRFESIMTGTLLTNVVGAVTADMMPFHAVPAASTEYFRSGVTTVATRSSADGNLSFSTGAPASGTAQWYLSPPNFYVGAAMFEQGSPLQPVVGREIVQNDITNWRLSNGLVRVTPNASVGRIDVSHWKGAAWATAKTYKFSGAASGIFPVFQTLTLLRNSVEEVTIRLGGVFSFVLGHWNLDLTLRRGDRIVRGYLSVNTADTWTIARDTAELATAITYGAVTLGGFRATNNDADGNRYVLLSYQQAVTSDLTNGKITTNANVMTADFGIGSEIGGSGAVAPDRAVDIAQQYLAAQSEKQQTVAR